MSTSLNAVVNALQLAEDLLMAGRLLNNLDPKYRHDLRLYLVVYTLERLRTLLPLKQSAGSRFFL